VPEDHLSVYSRALVSGISIRLWPAAGRNPMSICRSAPSVVVTLFNRKFLRYNPTMFLILIFCIVLFEFAGGNAERHKEVGAFKKRASFDDVRMTWYRTNTGPYVDSS
jgi:hypothetical protein